MILLYNFVKGFTVNRVFFKGSFCERHFFSPMILFFYLILASISMQSAAQAEVAVVAGTYWDRSVAEKAVERGKDIGFDLAIVTTKQKGFKFRVISGCYKSNFEASNARRKMARKGYKGLWLLQTSLGCDGAKSDAESVVKDERISSGVKKASGQNLIDRKIFAPKKWQFKSGDKVAYTDGENPALYFNKDLGNDDVCRVVISKVVSDYRDIEPPSNENDYMASINSKYFKGGSCKVAFVFEVVK